MNGKNYNYNIYFLDWLNSESDERYFSLVQRYTNVYRIPVGVNLADTIRQIRHIATTDYFWVVSSLTDYSHFYFEDYNEYQFEPYMQVFGDNTWFAGKYYIDQIDPTNEYIESWPNLHFVETTLKSDSKLLDIVHISNGEPLAEKHYQQLIKTAKLGNKIHRIQDINGRTEAYQAAARLSTTAWFFAVFSKLEVSDRFDWSWLPDQIQGPKHYIFEAINPVNGLIYGHMAMIAYNKFLTLDTNDSGIDFTLSRPNACIPILSGIAHYNQDPLVTWRTAFREAIKLKLENSDIARARLVAWLNNGRGDFAKWSMRGARAGVDYFDSVNGDPDQLMLTYNWKWLNDHFRKLYNQ